MPVPPCGPPRLQPPLPPPRNPGPAQLVLKIRRLACFCTVSGVHGCDPLKRCSCKWPDRSFIVVRAGADGDGGAARVRGGVCSLQNASTVHCSPISNTTRAERSK